MMDRRIKKLEQEHHRAVRSLRKTLDTHDTADAQHQRRMEDLSSKNSWLNYQNQALAALRERNTQLREERKANIERQR